MEVEETGPEFGAVADVVVAVALAAGVEKPVEVAGETADEDIDAGVDMAFDKEVDTEAPTSKLGREQEKECGVDWSVSEQGFCLEAHSRAAATHPSRVAVM